MQALVDDILGSLAKQNIDYCLERNRDRIPEGLLEWSDIDLIVSKQSNASAIIRALEHLLPAQVVNMRPGEISFFFPIDDLYLRVDVFYRNLEWRGAVYIKNENVIRSRCIDRGYFVAAPVYQAFIAWSSKLLWTGKFPVKYEQIISHTARTEAHTFGALLEYAFGPELGRNLLESAQAGRPADSSSLVWACRRSLWMRQLRQHPISLFYAFSRQMGNGLVKRMRPTGVDVALLGPDGAGKTSVALRIVNLPSRKLTFGRVEYVRLSRRVLPPFSQIKGFILRHPTPPETDAHNPQGTRTHSPLLWFVKYLYYALDLWLEQWWLRGQLAHTNLVVKDRHLVELPIDPRRYRYNGPPALVRLIAHLVPKPTLLIVLDAPPDVLHARKQDLTLEESKRQRGAYLRLAHRARRGYVVDSTQPLEEVERQVLNIVNEFVTDRTRSRMARRGLVIPDPR